MDPLLVTLIGIITLGYGTATSFLQERFGKFHGLPSTAKQAVNGVINLILPYIAIYLQPYWRPSFGDLNEAVTSAFYLIVPLLVWVVSQVAHRLDPHQLKR